jgi:hypothetical protein
VVIEQKVVDRQTFRPDRTVPGVIDCLSAGRAMPGRGYTGPVVLNPHQMCPPTSTYASPSSREV